MTSDTRVMYTPLVEHNDWEGETWTWWVQVNGNEAALKDLKDLTDQDEDYEFDPFDADLWVDEEEVDILVRHSHDGYFDDHNKVTGRLQVSPTDQPDVLYKGGVRELFT